MRTRMIESPPCIPAFVVIWCTRHSLKLIEAILSTNKASDGGVATAITIHTHTLTRQEEAITELRKIYMNIVSK